MLLKSTESIIHVDSILTMPSIPMCKDLALTYEEKSQAIHQRATSIWPDAVYRDRATAVPSGDKRNEV